MNNKTEIRNRLDIASPGGAMPAMNYKNRERGTGTGHAVAGTSANGSRMSRKEVDAELYGTGLLGRDLAPKKSGELSRRFMVPPFTVLNAREGWWQDRKKAWLSLGIQSELGRGENILGLSEQQQQQMAKGSAYIDENGRRQTGYKPPSADVTAPAPTEAKRTAKPQPRGAPTIQKKRFAAPTVISGDDEDRSPGRSTAGRANTPQAVRWPLAESSLIIKARTYGERLIDFGPWDDSKPYAVGMDIESFANFFLICFKNFNNGMKVAFELSERSGLNLDHISKIISTHCIVGFNSTNYDMPMLALALKGAGTNELKGASDAIIFEQILPWKIEERLGIRLPNTNHVDLSESNPSVRQSLKILNGRLHGRYMMDLPYEPDSYLSLVQMNVATLYCMNDLDSTELLFRALLEPLKLRVTLGKRWGLDLRSKSDAQVGEAVVLERVRRATGRRAWKRPDSHPPFQYQIPSFIRFSSPQMNEVLDRLRNETFHTNAHGIEAPKWLKETRLTFGSSTLQMGIGGLHSMENERSLISDDEKVLIDVDVTGHYPATMEKLDMYPPMVGPAFVPEFGGMRRERNDAKKRYQANEEDKEALAESEGGKIAVNGIFGKVMSVRGVLSSPPFGLAITLTGQLTVLMLVERAVAAGMDVASGNTDGVLFNMPRRLEADLSRMLKEWETETGFEVEMTRYRAVYNRDVNTYIAVKENGKVKRKGPVANPWADNDLRGQMSKNPQMEVCSDALVERILHGTPFEDTIMGRKDMRDFVTVTTVKEGAAWRGSYLGRVIRYYWSLDGDPILRAKSKAKVGKTAGARPLMEMDGTVPDDVDYARYLEETTELAYSLAVLPRPQHQKRIMV